MATISNNTLIFIHIWMILVAHPTLMNGDSNWDCEELGGKAIINLHLYLSNVYHLSPPPLTSRPLFPLLSLPLLTSLSPLTSLPPLILHTSWISRPNGDQHDHKYYFRIVSTGVIISLVPGQTTYFTTSVNYVVT